MNQWQRMTDDRRRENARRRFHDKFLVCEQSGCWLWLGGLNPHGYGRFKYRGHVYAHRWSYEHHVGPIPDGLTLDHKCGTPRCVNPAHLEPVTMRENILRGNGRAARNAKKKRWASKGATCGTCGGRCHIRETRCRECWLKAVSA